MRWNNGRPEMRYGYTDMGPIQIPGLPMTMGLTDRGTGTVYYLTHTTSEPGPDGDGFISLSTSPPSGPTVVYGAYEGPIFDTNPTLRLLVRDTRIGYEIVTYEGLRGQEKDYQQGLLTRYANRKETRKIVKPVGWVADTLLPVTVQSNEIGWAVEVIP